MVQFRRDWLTQIDMMQRETDRLLDYLQYFVCEVT